MTGTAAAGTAAGLLDVADTLADRCDALHFGGSVACVYNPLRYARAGFAEYLRRYAGAAKPVLLVGMNPGPFGMVQCGVPFGHVGLVRDWLGIEVPIEKPRHEHPKRPVLGFGCTRGEVSGERLWGWARDRFVTPERFFERFLVLNYCPLAFMEESGRNLTPDKLAAAERAALYEACDEALAASIDLLEPSWLLGIGAFAAARLAAPAAARGIPSGSIPHPSPASPAANRGWSEAAERALAALGIRLGPAPAASRASRDAKPLAPQETAQPRPATSARKATKAG